jgi:hypothetical protein
MVIIEVCGMNHWRVGMPQDIMQTIFQGSVPGYYKNVARYL